MLFDLEFYFIYSLHARIQSKVRKEYRFLDSRSYTDILIKLQGVYSNL